MYRGTADSLEVLLVHPGGPYWRNKDLGAWSIPKGEIVADEQPEAAARREFEEELGTSPDGLLQPLGEVRQGGGKRVLAYALRGTFDTRTASSNTFDMEWPPRSGRMRSFPEVDRAEWFELGRARVKLIPRQVPFLDRLTALLTSA